MHVPNKNKCLVSADTKEKREATGAVTPRLTALTAVPPEVSHLNVPPSKTVAIKSSPKLSNDH